jgi:hypothetical protein
MRITDVDSTTLAVVAYDEARELLQLEFRSRTVYRYFGVPAGVHEDLLRAPSHGRYFNAEIGGHFRCARVAKAGEA